MGDSIVAGYSGTPRRSWGLGALAGSLLLAGLLGPLAQPAGAHARLVGSNPESDELLDDAPDAVELYFDEEVEANDDGIEVIGPDGQNVRDGDAEMADGGAVLRLPIAPEDGVEGTFTVGWRVTSMDTHVLNGSFVFHVGARTGAAELDDSEGTGVAAIGWLGRWLGFAGSVTALGSAVLALATADAAVRARLRRLVVGGGVVAATGVALAMVSRVAEITGRAWFDALTVVHESAVDARSVQYLGWRVSLLILLAVSAAVGWSWRRFPALAVSLGAGSLLVASLSGHAWTADHRVLAVVADAAHFGAVAVWVGGLLALLVALPVASDPKSLARRFSALALGSVVVVAAAGTVLGWQHLAAVGDLTSTGYGRMLAGKVLLFGVLIGFGWWNRARLIQRIERSINPLMHSLRAEVVIAAVVLGLTASLVVTPPARSYEGSEGASDQPFSEIVVAEGEVEVEGTPVQLQLDVVPARTGDNEFHLNFLDGDGQPLEMLVAQAEVSLGDTPPRGVDLSLLTPSHAIAENVALPNTGTWTVQVTALPVKLDESVIFTFEVPIS